MLNREVSFEMARLYRKIVLLCLLSAVLFGCGRQNTPAPDSQKDAPAALLITGETNTFTLEEAKTIKVRVRNPNDEPLYFGGSGGKLSGCLEKQDGTDWQAVKTDRAVFPDLAQLGGGEEKELVIDTAGTILAPGSYRFVVPWQTAAENEKERRDSFLGTAADPGSYSHDAFFCFSVTA